MKPHYRVQQAVGVVKHSTLEEAQAEAERLAEKFSGVPFEILQCVGTTQTAKPQTFWMDGVIPPHVCAMHRAMDGTCFVCSRLEAQP
jgi:hypothetical protein